MLVKCVVFLALVFSGVAYGQQQPPTNSQPPIVVTIQQPVQPWYLRPEWIGVIITAVYVVIAGLTLLAIKRQADWMKTQAGHMASQVGLMQEQLNEMKASGETLKQSVESAKLSAETAQLNVDYLINKERGRIFVELAPFDIKDTVLNTQGVKYKVIYHGSSVSFHESSDVEFRLTDSKEPPEVTGPGGWLKSKRMSEIPPVIPANSIEFECETRMFHEFDHYELDRISHKQSFVHFYGYIEYKDFMEKTHVTTFCYTWEPPPPGHVSFGFAHWEKSGKPEANRET